MKTVFFLMMIFGAMNVQAQSNATTELVDNRSDKLYTTIHRNPGRETIILLHGGPGFPGDLTEVVEILKSDFQVITFHQRGTRLSPCESADYSMNAYVSDVNAIAQHYGVTKFHLWGHSWGGLYAQVYAESFKNNLLSLFLCCPGSGTNAEWEQTEKEVMELNRAKTTLWEWSLMGVNSMLGAMGSDAAYKRLFRQVMKNYNDDFIKTDGLAIDFENLKAEPINKTRPEIIKYPLLKKMENAPFKITIIYGDGDIYQSSKDFVINRYPTATVVTLKNCGHIPWLHNPADYTVVLKSHFKQSL
jgi:proline iminopeptidase